MSRVITKTGKETVNVKTTKENITIQAETVNSANEVLKRLEMNLASNQAGVIQYTAEIANQKTLIKEIITALKG